MSALSWEIKNLGFFYFFFSYVGNKQHIMYRNFFESVYVVDLLESPHQGDYNEHPQHILYGGIWKLVPNHHQITLFILN